MMLLSPPSRKETIACMDNFAKMISVEFMEWAGKKGYKYYKGNWYRNGINYHNAGSSADLYKIFIKEISGQ